MNSENLKSNDNLQLQQIIIHLKAELAKYKYEVDMYKVSDQNLLLAQLDQENVQLMNEKKELIAELTKVKADIEKDASDYKKRIHLYEILSEKDLKTINALQVNITAIQQLERNLVDLIRKSNKKAFYKLRKLEITNKERGQNENIRQELVSEIQEKNKLIKKLQNEIMDLKEHIEMTSVIEKSQNENEASSDSNNVIPAIDFEELMQLEIQIKEVVAQSLEYKEKIDAKLLVINDFEHKLDLLTGEIEGMN